MKKFFLTMLLLVAAVSFLSAASISFNSRDKEALKAVLKTNLPHIQRVAYELRLRELEGRIKVRNYEEYCRWVFRIGMELKVKPSDIEDFKIALPFISGRFTPDALKAAHETMHPYELRFLTTPRCKWYVKKLMPTPKDRYMRTLALIKWNTAKYNAWGNNGAEIIKGLEYMRQQAVEGRLSRFNSDMKQLKLVFKSWQINNPKLWKPVYDWIDRNAR